MRKEERWMAIHWKIKIEIVMVMTRSLHNWYQSRENNQNCLVLIQNRLVKELTRLHSARWIHRYFYRRKVSVKESSMDIVWATSLFIGVLKLFIVLLVTYFNQSHILEASSACKIKFCFLWNFATIWASFLSLPHLCFFYLVYPHRKYHSFSCRKNISHSLVSSFFQFLLSSLFAHKLLIFLLTRHLGSDQIRFASLAMEWKIESSFCSNFCGESNSFMAPLSSTMMRS